jgi:hypothetical protein
MFSPPKGFAGFSLAPAFLVDGIFKTHLYFDAHFLGETIQGLVEAAFKD